MGSQLDKLIRLSGPALAPPHSGSALSSVSSKLGHELGTLLGKRNGFYAFEAALHVFPTTTTSELNTDLDVWNEDSVWKSAYHGMASGCFFFAEDVFGSQFCIHDSKVHLFDAETGSKEWVANSLEGWAHSVLDNYNELTGFPLAHEWQKLYGPLPAGLRLVPKTPFVLGGDFSVSNLYALDAVKGMRLRGNIAVQLRDLPDGTEVTLEAVE